MSTASRRMPTDFTPSLPRRETFRMPRRTTSRLPLVLGAAVLILASLHPIQRASAQMGHCEAQLCIGVSGNGDYLSHADITDLLPTEWCGTYRVTVTHATTGVVEQVGAERTCKGAGRPTAVFATYSWYQDGDRVCADATPDRGYPTRAGRPCTPLPL
jgi:hypothetical protein